MLIHQGNPARLASSHTTFIVALIGLSLLRLPDLAKANCAGGAASCAETQGLSRELLQRQDIVGGGLTLNKKNSYQIRATADFTETIAETVDNSVAGKLQVSVPLP
ncbi:MAG: hypothetical protein ACR2J1_02200 [Methyloceanibacter sp.]|uniref:hypothetical protein n=1 Tax=Methyloceanibacter sp. TaxID=1965321 RepID=UPI003D9B2D15